MENVKLFIAHDPAAPYDKSVDALTFRRARNLRLRDVEIVWDGPAYEKWKSALALEDVDGADLRGSRPGRRNHPPRAPLSRFRDVRSAWIHERRAAAGRGSSSESPPKSRDLLFSNNDTREAKTGVRSSADVTSGTIIK
jgi:hypothetical protein